jgi:4-hydroxythreonine-4-phosphate dehydrogenase
LKRKPVKIGITIGDPAGIGPEVSLKAVDCLEGKSIIPLLIGRREVVEKLYPGLIKGCQVIDNTECDLLPGNRYFYTTGSDRPLPEPGCGSPETGGESLEYIDTALELWKKGFIDAIATAPVSKEFIQKSGVEFSGHTEYIAEKTCGSKPLMLMYSPEFRVIPVTTHIPVSEIIHALSAERITEAIVSGAGAMEEIDGKKPQIAVAGLDPHCGDGGAIGDFDERVTKTAVENAVKRGIDTEGPLSADTLFMRDNWKKYSLAIAMYHDQGLIPFKVLAFEKGVNTTLGLKIVRTSADHGTAYNLAGKGDADHRSMLEAILLAYRLVLNKKREPES